MLKTQIVNTTIYKFNDNYKIYCTIDHKKNSETQYSIIYDLQGLPLMQFLGLPSW